MARIRSIHPGLLTDEAFMILTVKSPLAVALYIGLLMESDDHGVFEWKPLTLKARILPAVSDDVEALLEALTAQRFVMSYDLDGRKFGAVRNFCRFQKPKKPNPIHPKTTEVRNWVAHKEDLVPTGGELVGNQDGTGGEIRPQMEDGGDSRKEISSLRSESRAGEPDQPEDRSRNQPSRPPSNGSRIAADWQPSAADVAYAETEGISGTRITRTAAAFLDYWLAKAGADGRKADWSATWRNWVRREAERTTGPPRPAETRPTRGVASALAGIEAYSRSRDQV